MSLFKMSTIIVDFESSSKNKDGKNPKPKNIRIHVVLPSDPTKRNCFIISFKVLHKYLWISMG